MALKKINKLVLTDSATQEQGELIVPREIQLTGDVSGSAIVNDKTVAISVSLTGGTAGGVMLAPEITSPKDGQENVPVFTSVLSAGPYRSAFEDDARSYRQFQVGEINGDWDSPVIDANENSDSYTIPEDKQLSPNTGYQWRCRDVSSWGMVSPWSDTGKFFTGSAAMVLTPTLTVPGAPDSVENGLTLTTSAFATTGAEDTHDLTDWKVVEHGTQKAVFSKPNSTVSLTRVDIGKNVLSPNTTYDFMARHKGKALGWSEWATVTATTIERFATVAAPATITIPGAPNSVQERPTITAGAFTVDGGEDLHAATDWIIYADDGKTEKWSSKNDQTNLTSITIPAGILQTSTAYVIKARYKGAELGWGDYASATFSTAAAFYDIDPPQITVCGAPDNAGSPIYAKVTVPENSPSRLTMNFLNVTLFQGDSQVDTKQIELRYTGNMDDGHEELITFSSNIAASTEYRIVAEYAATDWELGGSGTDVTAAQSEISFATRAHLNVLSFDWKGTINLSEIFDISSSNLSKFNLYRNGVLDNDWLTNKFDQDVELSSEGETIELEQPSPSLLVPFPFPRWAGKDGLLKINCELPLIRYAYTTPASYPTTDFGGDPGDATGNWCNDGKKLGLCANCTSLYSVPGFMFVKNQPRNFGGMGGGGGGGSAFSSHKGGDGSDYSVNSLWGNTSGKGGTNSAGSDGVSGYGCFYGCTALKTIPKDLLAGITSAVINVGGLGGGGGGASYSSSSQQSFRGGKGGDGYGMFCASGITEVPDGLFNDICQANADNTPADENGDTGLSFSNYFFCGGLGGGRGGKNGGNGGDGYGCFANCKSLAKVGSLITNSNLSFSSAQLKGNDGSTYGGGKGYSMFYGCSSLTTLKKQDVFFLAHDYFQYLGGPDGSNSTDEGYGGGDGAVNGANYGGNGGGGYYGGGGGASDNADGGNGKANQEISSLSVSFNAPAASYDATGTGVFENCNLSSLPDDFILIYPFGYNFEKFFYNNKNLTADLTIYNILTVPLNDINVNNFAAGTKAKGTVKCDSNSSLYKVFLSTSSANVNLQGIDEL